MEVAMSGSGHTASWHSSGQNSLIFSKRYFFLSYGRPCGSIVGGRMCGDGLVLFCRSCSCFSAELTSVLTTAVPGLSEEKNKVVDRLYPFEGGWLEKLTQVRGPIVGGNNDPAILGSNKLGMVDVGRALDHPSNVV